MSLRVKYVLGEELRKERDERALTQKQAAAEVGVSRRTWQHWEDGSFVPRVEHRRQLSAWLELEAPEAAA